MIAILILLLAVTSGLERNRNYMVDYVKLNRIVFIVFILSAYLAFNILDVKILVGGIGIYGGVFKITVLSQIFDIIMLIIGGIVSLLTCFMPYNIKNKLNLDATSVLEKIYLDNKSFLKSHLSSNNFFLNNIIKFLPKIKLNTPYLLEKRYNDRLEVKEYNFLLLFTVLGGSLLISSQNLISLYLSLELQSFSLYILSTSQIGSFKSTSGGLKYFLLGGLSSGLIILGCSLLYAYTGTLNLEHIFMIYSDNITNNFIDPCLIILFAGLLFKVSAAPFHNWAPDVYSDVSTNSTTWLIIIAKLSVLVFMFLLIHNIYTGINLNNLNMIEEYCSFYNINSNVVNVKDNSIKDGTGTILYLNQNFYNDKYMLYNINNIQSFSLWNPHYSSLGLWTNVLILSALISLIIGTILGISQSRIKRLFAYSTIAHVGFLLLGLSINTVSSIDAFIFYLIQYSITNLNLFFILIAWGYLYCTYFLSSNNLHVCYLKSDLWKDNYVKSHSYDYLKLILSNSDKYSGTNNLDYLMKLNSNIMSYKYSDEEKKEINIIQKYLINNSDINYYDFNNENKEWIFTPVPYLTHFKGMHIRDPFLAFCLAVTIFSLAGECLLLLYYIIYENISRINFNYVYIYIA
jgi:NADH-ubiquinone oxidoreductase chain 2